MHKLMGKLAVGVLLLAMAGSAVAEDRDSKAIDQKVYTSLRDVINRGADMYNNGDAAGCYRLFEGALLAVRPLLDHRAELQKSIDAGLASAPGNPDMRRRAWALRRVLDDVRDQVHGKAPAAVAKGGKKEELIGRPEKSLWDRLGGEPAVSKVVDDFTEIAGPDPKVNFTRDGKYKPTDEQMVALKKSLVAFISSATGGPLKYTGKSMKEVHKGMGITNEEFDAIGADLVQALAKNGVAKENIAALMAIVETTRKDIVEAKAEPKDEDKPKEKEKPKAKDDEKKDDDKPKEKDEKKDEKKDDDKPKEKDDKKDEKKDDKEDK
jgi:hemoglobin